MIQSRIWVFRVTCQLEAGEMVFVTGSCGSLGCWDPQNLVPLTAEDSHRLLTHSCPAVWTTTVEIPIQETEYRFVICKPLKKGNGVIYSIKKWETDLHPRIIPANASNTEDCAILDFGFINEYRKVDEGWLVEDSTLFLRLCKSIASTDSPITFWKKKHREKRCFMKVTPIDISKSRNVDSFLDYHADESTEAELTELRANSKALMPSVEVSILKDNFAEFRAQEQFGASCTDEEYLVFRCRLPELVSIGFLADFYSEVNTEGDPPKFIGSSIMLSSSFHDTYGNANVPITSPKHIPIGELTVSYMVVHPLDGPKCNLKVSYARYWKDSWKGLEVGHRGAGNSFHSQPKNCSNIRENTIASLKHAFESGADMVEFDVQLSKDFVPLIYHDFHALISLRHKKEPLKTDLVELPIKDLTLTQLQALKLYHKTEKGSSRFSDELFEDHQPFPSLEQVLQSVPPSCGFNIEIKWNMRLKDGTYELKHPFELNRFLDKILKVVLENKSPRKIIFSCFHPDICTMIRLKQHLYPVLFLTQGEFSNCPSYEDIRTRSIDRAILYASSANILGINVHSSDLLNNTAHFTNALDYNLVVFCWGDLNSDRDTIQFLKELGLHGIIYDKIDVYNTKKSKKGNVFLCDDKETCRCFPSSCRLNKENGEHRQPQTECINVNEETHSPQSSYGSPGVDNVSPDTDGETHSPVSNYGSRGVDNVSPDADFVSKSEKRPLVSEDEQCPKRTKSENGGLDGSRNGSPTTFCGILSEDIELVSSNT